MKAGRELDALIAEKVMGLDVHNKVNIFYNRPKNQKHGWQNIPHYSTKIADAWLVVEKLANEGFCPALIYDDDGSWTMAFDGIQNLPEDDEPLITSFCIEAKMIADTAPLAICLAALKAIE